jgi:hypothetical protein
MIRVILKQINARTKSSMERPLFFMPDLSRNEAENDSKPNPVDWEDGVLDFISPVSDEARISVL